MSNPQRDGPQEPDAETPPWPQQLYDSIWLIAGTALLFWVLSYILWRLIDILTLLTAPTAG